MTTLKSFNHRGKKITFISFSDLTFQSNFLSRFYTAESARLCFVNQSDYLWYNLMPFRENVVRIISHWIRLSAAPLSYAKSRLMAKCLRRHFLPLFHSRSRHNIQLVTTRALADGIFFHIFRVMCLQGIKFCDKFKF